jgi:Helix-turn-helix domain
VKRREVAEYMGIRVTTLRAWRVRRSETGPPFVRLGRMILYPLAELENHVQAGLVSARRKQKP